MVVPITSASARDLDKWGIFIRIETKRQRSIFIYQTKHKCLFPSKCMALNRGDGRRSCFCRVEAKPHNSSAFPDAVWSFHPRSTPMFRYWGLTEKTIIHLLESLLEMFLIPKRQEERAESWQGIFYIYITCQTLTTG